MKKYCYFLVSTCLFLSFSACNTGNRQDIASLIDPASLPYLKNSKLIQVSSSDSSGGNNDHITIPPGKKATIFNVEGPGMISRIWFKIHSQDPYYLRRIVIRIYWDRETKPSVEAPLGDFFGNGFVYNQYVSQYLGMTSGGFVCYFPMPFESRARIEIANETLHEISALYYQINFQKFEAALESDVAYFHALWKREIQTTGDSNYVVLNATGQGHVVGVNLNLQSYNGGFSYLEGDEMIYVDGEKKPSIAGTGTEDFFSGGGYFSKGVYNGPYSGLMYKDDSLGRIAAYRLFVVDPIPFRKGIIFTFEHGHANLEVADYSSTIYWYQMEPHKPFPAFPKAGQRIPLRIVKPSGMTEAENLKFNLGGLKSRVADMSDYGPDWGENKQLIIESHDKSTFGLTLNGLKDVMYDLTLYYTKSPDYGNVELFVNGTKAGVMDGYSPYVLPEGKMVVSNIKNSGQTIELTFLVNGKNKNAKGYYFGIDGLNLVPKRVFIPGWYILGPFPNPRNGLKDRRGLDSVYAPEKNSNIKMVYSGVDQKPISWKYVKTPERGYVSFSDTMYPDELVVAYAITYIYAKTPQKVVLYVGTDDGGKVFLNDKEVYRFSGLRIAVPDQAEVELDLKQGWNKLLLKVENNMGGFGFYARLLDHNHALILNADQKLPIK